MIVLKTYTNQENALIDLTYPDKTTLMPILLKNMIMAF